jgi:hypothetical protein
MTADAERQYRNDVRAGYAGQRCPFAAPGASRLCGLPAWADAAEDEPRCEFHSVRKPPDSQQRLEAAGGAEYG